MNPLKRNLLLVSVITLFTSSAMAGYVGKNGGNINQSVKSILDNPIDDSRVVLEGYITEKVRPEKYLFADTTGTIRIEIDDKDFPNQPVDEKTLVKIYGDVEKDFLESPEIDVDFMEIIK